MWVAVCWGVSALACAIMVGVIWLVELVVYPAFADVPAENWQPWHERHTQALGVIAGPTMIVELASGLACVALAPGWLAGVSAALVVGTWVVTFGWAVPAHQRLAAGYDRYAVQCLRRVNRWRTVLWSVRLVVVATGAWVAIGALA